MKKKLFWMIMAMMLAVVTWAQTGDKKNEEKVTRLKNKLEAKIDYYNKNVSTMSSSAHELCLQRIGDLIESIRKYEPDFMITMENKPTYKMFTVNGVSFKMIIVEGSTTLDDFYIGETEVTQALWKAVMGEENNPSYFEGEDLPVESVYKWPQDNIIKNFLHKLYLQTGYEFRWPTPAEWEYAARGGMKSQGYKYSGSNAPDDVAWLWENSGDERLSGRKSDEKTDKNNCRTHMVKSKKPNELGIYDMTGNVWELCQGGYIRGGGWDTESLKWVWGGPSEEVDLIELIYSYGSVAIGINRVGLRLALSLQDK